LNVKNQHLTKGAQHEAVLLLGHFACKFILFEPKKQIFKSKIPIKNAWLTAVDMPWWW
jgi:hypothetical protein